VSEKGGFQAEIGYALDSARRGRWMQSTSSPCGWMIAASHARSRVSFSTSTRFRVGRGNLASDRHDAGGNSAEMAEHWP
jgi:hypothetical protein